MASADQAYVLTLQTDGNLVLYQVIGTPPVDNGSITASALWATAGDTGRRQRLLADAAH